MSQLIAAILALLHPHPVAVATPATTATTVPVRPPVPVTQPKAEPSPQQALGAVWGCIREHESGDNYADADSGGNGHFGAYQFSRGTWNTAVTGAGWPQYANGRADHAPPGVQDSAAVWLQAHAGWSQWSTARGCGA